MKNLFKLKTILRIAGIIAIAAVIGFSMVACSDDNGGGPGGGGSGGGGGGSSGLVGKWYSDKETADAVAAGKGYSYNDYLNLGLAGNLPDGAVLDEPTYEFKSNGQLYIGMNINTGFTYTATASTITLNYSGYTYPASANYSISGKTLTLNAPEGSGLLTGTYYKAR